MGFSFPEAGSHQSVSQVVSAMVRSPGLLVTCLWRKGMSLQHQPNLRKKRLELLGKQLFGNLTGVQASAGYTK